VKGTPLEDFKTPSGLEMVRAIAVARIVMPKTVVRLSAGRSEHEPVGPSYVLLSGREQRVHG
jgi:biotin synthase